MPSAPKNTPYWSQPIAETVTALEGSTAGLTVAAAQARLAAVGPNLVTEHEQQTALRLFLSQLQSPIMVILLVATLISAGLGDWVDAVIILIIVFGSAFLSFIQERNANQAIADLKAQVAAKTTVLRDGQMQTIAASQVVPGDVVLLSAGSLIPADSIVLEAHDLFVNQAVLTGETLPVEKIPGVVAAASSLAERTNMLFMGTNVRSGSARALVVQTGKATAFGQIADQLALRPPLTEFERGIRRLGYLLSEVMLLLVLGIFAVNVFFHKPVVDSLLFSVALAVGLTPQLLPAIINVNLAKGAQAMAAEGVIVRRLNSIENFGSMDVLCTDKTGTLTQGVVQLDDALDAAGQPSETVFRSAYLNAALQTGLTNPLDEAILARTRLAIDSVQKLDEIPYDFTRKRLSVVVQDGDERQLITKGAFNQVIAICTLVQNAAGVTALDTAALESLNERYIRWSEQGFRVLGVATRRVAAQSLYTLADEEALTFAGFLLFFDPPKPGVKQTVADLARLGVELKIITGDNKPVALPAAQAIGLAVTGAITGAELNQLADEALWHQVARANLFAEVDPNQKERIITALQKTGHVVGYMGDGINDAPSLHAADVGISVDQAVDVAKEAADLVLLRKELSVLHDGVVQGRRTFANTIKYVFIATSANFGNMFSMAFASLFLPFLPMLPKQILLLNFLTDLPEMMIATDNVDPVMVQRPHRWDITFIRRFMLVFGPLSSIFDLLTFAVMLVLLPGHLAAFRTGWFLESLISATLVVFVVRTRLPLWQSQPSRPMILATSAVIAITLLLPYTPLAGPLGFVQPTGLVLVFVIGISLLYLASAELTKRWFYSRYAPDKG